MTNVFFDTEFIEDGTTIDLLSVGIVVGSRGEAYYAQSAECALGYANEFVREHVFPSLEGAACAGGVWERDVSCPLWKPRAQIRIDVQEFVARHLPCAFWTNYGAYDWVALCQLFGRMIDLPRGWPMYYNDLQQTLRTLGVPDAELPPPPAGARPHHALDDARHLSSCLAWLAAEFPGERL